MSVVRYRILGRCWL